MKSEMEGGYEISRPRHFRVLGEWNLKWNAMSSAHYASLLSFYKTETIGGSVAFSWTCPNNGTAYTVRFKGDIKATPVTSGLIAGSPVVSGITRYAVEFTLREV